MQNKLQELTDKLYKEGLSKGQKEGEELIQKAQAQAAEILANAQKDADSIIAGAKKDAENLKTKTASDVKMAAAQSISATKHDIESLIVTKMTDEPVKKALSSSDFVKEVITAVAKGFQSSEATDLELVLPESQKKDLEPFVKNELSKILKAGVVANFSKKISGGFTIGPKEGGYFVSFTDETFKELISEYLRPATKKLLYD